MNHIEPKIWQPLPECKAAPTNDHLQHWFLSLMYIRTVCKGFYMINFDAIFTVLVVIIPRCLTP